MWSGTKRQRIESPAHAEKAAEIKEIALPDHPYQIFQIAPAKISSMISLIKQLNKNHLVMVTITDEVQILKVDENKLLPGKKFPLAGINGLFCINNLAACTCIKENGTFEMVFLEFDPADPELKLKKSNGKLDGIFHLGNAVALNPTQFICLESNQFREDSYTSVVMIDISDIKNPRRDIIFTPADKKQRIRLLDVTTDFVAMVIDDDQITCFKFAELASPDKSITNYSVPGQIITSIAGMENDDLIIFSRPSHSHSIRVTNPRFAGRFLLDIINVSTGDKTPIENPTPLGVFTQQPGSVVPILNRFSFVLQAPLYSISHSCAYFWKNFTKDFDAHQFHRPARQSTYYTADYFVNESESKDGREICISRMTKHPDLEKYLNYLQQQKARLKKDIESFLTRDTATIALSYVGNHFLFNTQAKDGAPAASAEAQSKFKPSS